MDPQRVQEEKQREKKRLVKIYTLFAVLRTVTLIQSEITDTNSLRVQQIAVRLGGQWQSTVACLPCIDWRACGTIVKPTVRLMSNLQQTSTSKKRMSRKTTLYWETVLSYDSQL